jgi:hypothetical protein
LATHFALAIDKNHQVRKQYRQFRFLDYGPVADVLCCPDILNLFSGYHAANDGESCYQRDGTGWGMWLGKNPNPG